MSLPLSEIPTTTKKPNQTKTTKAKAKASKATKYKYNQ